jgi:hypothetical protein
VDRLLSERFLPDALQALHTAGLSMPGSLCTKEGCQQRLISEEEFAKMLERGHIRDCFTVGKRDVMNIKRVTRV